MNQLEMASRAQIYFVFTYTGLYTRIAQVSAHYAHTDGRVDRRSMRRYVSTLSEHIEDMRATGVAPAHFKGGLRSKPPGVYIYLCVRPRSGPCDIPTQGTLT